MGIQRDAQTGKWLGASIPWAPPLAVVLYQPHRTCLPAAGAAACYFWARPFVENVMNEQLVVKNFGPIKDATVDFKRVTVFIGPTGGGKSTLAKLAAVFRNIKGAEGAVSLASLKDFGINNYWSSISQVDWNRPSIMLRPASSSEANDHETLAALKETGATSVTIAKASTIHAWLSEKTNTDSKLRSERIRKLLALLDEDEFNDAVISGGFQEIIRSSDAHYIPSERAFSAAIEYSKDGLMRDDIGLPKTILDFNNSFSLAKKNMAGRAQLKVDIPFFNAEYWHLEGYDFIKTVESENLLKLSETASGIQSVTPLLVLLEHLSRNTEQAQSFIIEEPELNLYPTAQRDLVYWLLEKCTQGENDLTITTHSPYVLSALNLALYASKVATLFPHQRQKVAKLIPEKYWLKAEEFSAYFVAKGGAKSIFDPKTGLLSESQLDEVSGEFADVFDRLTDLRIPEKKAPAKAKPARK